MDDFADPEAVEALMASSDEMLKSFQPDEAVVYSTKQNVGLSAVSCSSKSGRSLRLTGCEVHRSPWERSTGWRAPTTSATFWKREPTVKMASSAATRTSLSTRLATVCRTLAVVPYSVVSLCS